MVYTLEMRPSAVAALLLLPACGGGRSGTVAGGAVAPRPHPEVLFDGRRFHEVDGVQSRQSPGRWSARFARQTERGGRDSKAWDRSALGIGKRRGLVRFGGRGGKRNPSKLEGFGAGFEGSRGAAGGRGVRERGSTWVPGDVALAGFAAGIFMAHDHISAGPSTAWRSSSLGRAHGAPTMRRFGGSDRVAGASRRSSCRRQSERRAYRRGRAQSASRCRGPVRDSRYSLFRAPSPGGRARR